ncbi:MAG: hydrogenase iron-sulfur subunit [Clostridiales bacterium]|nr:hydrogenase iron-sulfur subunit [Clostridiales bacterium]
MNILIMGQSEINGILAERFEKRGYSAFIIEDASKIKAFHGESGCFKIRLGAGAVGSGVAEDREAAAVIVTETAGKAMPAIDGGKPVCLHESDDLRRIAGSRTKYPVVFLLDYFNESPQASTVKALHEARALALRKHNVIYIFRFMRSAGTPHESLYQAARKAGVTFIKYESLDIAYDKNKDLFQIKVSDGVNEVDILTKHVISDSGYGVDGAYAEIALKLRLRVNEAGYINEDRYMLSPTLTSRKGVYYFSGDTAADRISEGIDYTLSMIEADVGIPARAGEETDPEDVNRTEDYAIVDAEKCVFCYSCYRACPHGAMTPDEEARVMKNMKVACEACGICAAVCPGNAITITTDDFSDEREGKRGKVKLFCCENSGAVALQEVLPAMGDLASKIDAETLPCGGRIGFEQLSGALRQYGKVMALVCMDDACKHFDGNKRACRQAERLSAMLETAGIDPGKVEVCKISHAMSAVLQDTLIDFLKEGAV